VLTRQKGGPRNGASLIEIVIAMVVAGIVLSLVSSISVRQQRLVSEVTDGVAVAAQLREISTVLPGDLHGVASAAGDIREATDTAIELRATIASAVVCDTAANAFILAPAGFGVTAYASFTTTIEPGDTAWVFTPGDSVDEWKPFAIAGTASANTAGRQCAALGPRLSDSARALPRLSITVTPSPVPVAAMIGSPMRVTRALRYSLYRASDGRWYVGARDWNATLLRFNTVQPVSGPFLSAAASGMALSYFDSSDTRLPTPVVDRRTIAAIRASFRAQSKGAAIVLGSAASVGARIDSSKLVILLHNHR
jgi:hypothetical protein